MLIKTKISVFLIGLALLTEPSLSFAGHRDRGRGHYYRYHDHPHFGLHVPFLPEICFSLMVGGLMYYYYDGLYYRRFDRDYVVVEPPAGAIVRVVPGDFKSVVINGVTYYTDNGMYYIYTPQGYQIVPAPVVVTPALPVSPMVITQTPSQEESFTLNIPNDKSGYVSVIIKRSGNGFVGPQGEYYPEFPKVSQLKVMYAK